MSSAVDDVLASLEWRLNRLEHVVSGTNVSKETVSSNAVASEQPPILVRLEALDKRLSLLTRKHPVAADLLRLRERH